MVVDPMGVKVDVKFGDSWSNRARDIRLPHFFANDKDASRQTLRLTAFRLKIEKMGPK